MQAAVVRFEGPETTVVARALSPEGGRDVPQTRATWAQEGETLTLRLEANDTGALRAALNSYLRWVTLAAAMAREAGA